MSLSQIFSLKTEDQNARITGILQKLVGNTLSIVDLNIETTKIELLARKPDNSTITPVPMTITNDGTDGKFHYDTPSDFFSGQKQGYWHFQVRVTMSDGKILHTDSISEYIGEVLV